jgi:hypothetical protein
MKKYKDFVNEAMEYKIYKTKGSLWIAYDVGSGTSIPLTKTYLTDKKGDPNEDQLVLRMILKAIKTIKPVQKKGNALMFDLPMYDVYDDLSVWGGKNKPKKVGAFIVSTGPINVITFFDSKSEAKAWMKTTV